MAEVADNLQENENNGVENEIDPMNIENEEPEADQAEIDEDEFFFHEREHFVPPPNTTLFYLHMAPSCVMLAIVWWSFRTHNQFYPTILHLTTSKMAFCAFGTSVATLCLQFFRWVSHIFLGALRLTEREAIAEGMRWGLTETCLALTMFRDEMSLKVGGMFVLLVGAKGWHWAVEMRGKHLGNTQEVFYLTEDSKIPKVRWNHVKFLIFAIILFFLDIAAVYHCGSECAKHGPSVHILFGFEAAVLSITATSAVGLYFLHVWDGFLNVMLQRQERNKENITETQNNNQNGEESTQNQESIQKSVSVWEKLSHDWKERRGIYTLALGLLSQAATFLCYLLFFSIVFMYYGMPINIFRELYMSYQKLRVKISAFVTYWNLSRDVDNKFETVYFNTEKEEVHNDEDVEQDENDEDEVICIICRDEMTCGKKLPGCGHVFHAHCLKGWLMQSQCCPTCRSDIPAASARVAKMVDENREDEAIPEADNAEDSDEREEIDEAEKQKPESKDFIERETKSDCTDKRSASNNETESKASPGSAFPCLYKVDASGGAPVYSSLRASSRPAAGLALPDTIARKVPQNKFIICTDIQYMNSNMMLKMPDGWIKENDVKRIVAFPF